MPMSIFPITLEKSYLLSPRVKHFVFKAPEDIAFDFLPGQFITVHFERDGKTLRRSYSIANIPEQNNEIQFTAGFVADGPGTDLLFGLQPGDTININGPFGRLILKDELPERYIFVATSTGVTPYRAMLSELSKRLQQNPNLEVVILQGVQTREDVLFADEFLAFAANCPRVLFRAYLSREAVRPLFDHERTGYVQSAFPELGLNPDKDKVYLCGNPSMIDEAYALLTNKQFTSQHIIREKYISGK